MNLPQTLYRAREVRELDRMACEQPGVTPELLMARAGGVLFRVLRERFPACGKLLVMCGGGNNGGDGYVLARLALEAGLAVRVLALSEPENLQGAARAAYENWRSAGGCIENIPVADALADAEIICDALLGTGLDRPVQGAYQGAIRAVNALGLPVLAADMPSGLSADTGAILGDAIRADITVTFIGLKGGLFTGRGPDCCGEVIFDALDTTAGLADGLPVLAKRIDRSWLAELKPRRPAAHKGEFGQLLIVGGGAGMPGAARMAGEAALRGGVGRVTAAVWPENIAAVAAGCPEMMVRGVDAPVDLAELLAAVDVLVLGPGLGRSEWARLLWRDLIKIQKPLVLDADGLNLLAEEFMELPAGSIITPHPGEAARLLGVSVAEIESDRFAAAAALAEKFKAVAVLKGAGSLIAEPSGTLCLCPYGSPALASPGTGDVLAGVIGSLLAQGYSPVDAACHGVLVHALAGEAAARNGTRGVLARDVIASVKNVINRHD